jgi:hypothetical protein
MSIKQHLQTALNGIKADKERAIATAKEKAMRETIIPQHNEINKARDDAISAITSQHNAQMQELQDKFSKHKQELIEAAENKKSDVTASVTNCATAEASIAYDKTINSLEEQISKIQE